MSKGIEHFMFNLFINNKKMKKTTVTRAYEAPEVNVESINVEKGFALSGGGNFDDVTPGGNDPSDW